MADKRSERKASMVQFLSRLDKDRTANLASMIELAKQLEMEGFDRNEWGKDVWTITAGRLTKQGAKNIKQVTLSFLYAPKLGGGVLDGEWADVAKALISLRFHRDHQAIENQRNFISAVGYVAFEMASKKLRVFQLTPEYLNAACLQITKDYGAGSAYNMHKAIGEFAAHCDSNGLCNVHLNFKYSGMRRPDNTGGIGYKRLDDAETLNTYGEKLIEPKVFKILGELYKNVPVDHKYRFYILVLTLLAMLGRRFSEMSLIPYQVVSRDEEGEAYLKYFPRKASKGDVLTPLRNLTIPTEVVQIVEAVITELGQLCLAARSTAAEMILANGPDLTFLMSKSDDERLYKGDLENLGLPPNLLDATGWIRRSGLAYPDTERLTAQGKSPNSPFWFTTKAGVAAYCNRDFHSNIVEPIHIDQQGKKYFLMDMLLVRHLGLSSGFYAHWIATKCTHSMMTTFLRYFPELAEEYASSSI